MELFDVRFGKFAVVLLDNVVYGTEMIGGFDDVVYINRFIRHSDRVGFPSIGKFDSDIISTKVVFLADIGKKYYHILHLPMQELQFETTRFDIPTFHNECRFGWHIACGCFYDDGFTFSR